MMEYAQSEILLYCFHVPFSLFMVLSFKAIDFSNFCISIIDQQQKAAANQICMK